MKPMRFLIAALAMIGLSACYTSDAPLISDADSVAPFAKITFIGRGQNNDPAAFTREAEHYVTEIDGKKAFLHLKPIEDNDYVAQLTGDGSDASQILYAYLRIDPQTKTAEMWRSVGTKDDARPGLRVCRDAICIDDLDAYVAYAKEALAKPADTTFDIVVEIN